MKNTVLFLLISVAFFSCNTDDCENTEFTATSTVSGVIKVEVTAPDLYEQIEVHYGPTGFIVGQSNVIVDESESTFNLTSLTPGLVIDVYVRTKCDGDWTDYTGPKSVTVAGGSGGSCPKPTELDADQYGSSNYRMKWYDPGNAGYYQVEFGPTGFIQGSSSGTIQNANEGQLVETLSEGVYDFYVRSNCGGQEWSDWAGPHSFYVPN